MNDKRWEKEEVKCGNKERRGKWKKRFGREEHKRNGGGYLE